MNGKKKRKTYKKLTKQKRKTQLTKKKKMNETV